ncbi:MAG: nicotinate-nicotinamide nucleotide adenylyltransferase [Candidatus Solibacter usitatus]|nr:nicotinate-nicotinamide nucleotide adenylyltransferase [Candidatus Solibacter usitatus]
MVFFLRAAGKPAKLGILSGAFNPPTLAHLAMAEAALEIADEVLFVLPRVFPHKEYEGAGLEQRLDWLQAAVTVESRYSIGHSKGGLFIEIAHECRAAYGHDTELYFLCGRDAAERVVDWDYGPHASFREQLDYFQLLVAPRNGNFEPPAAIAHRVHVLPIPEAAQQISSTEVRRRMQAGEPWEHLVPPATVPLLFA